MRFMHPKFGCVLQKVMRCVDDLLCPRRRLLVAKVAVGMHLEAGTSPSLVQRLVLASAAYAQGAMNVIEATAQRSINRRLRPARTAARDVVRPVRKELSTRRVAASAASAATAASLEGAFLARLLLAAARRLRLVARPLLAAAR